MNEKLRSDVFHYGEIINDVDEMVCKNFIRQKIYSYNKKLYIEVLHNGECIFFEELKKPSN